MTPAISVLMSVYNGETYLVPAIESILNQTDEDFEFLIVNDGSTDGSKDIIDYYASLDSRIVVIEQVNAGLVAALNKGLKKARAPLVARMDADDIALPHRLAAQKAYMDSHPDIGVLGSAVELIDAQGRPLSILSYPDADHAADYLYERGSPLAHPAVMMRRDLVLAQGGYRAAYQHAEDYDLWLRLYLHAGIDNLPDILLQYRHHPDKISIRHIHQQALASIVARYAARTEPDPTQKLEKVSLETLTLFKGDLNKMAWEIIDVMAGSFLQTRAPASLATLEAQFPPVISDPARPIAARAFLKAAFIAAHCRLWDKTMRYTARALFLAPHDTMAILFEKLAKKFKLAGIRQKFLPARQIP